MRRTTPIITLAVVAGVTAILAACTAKKEPPATLPSTTASASTSAASPPPASPAAETQETATQRAIDTYVGMHNAFLKAGQTGNPDSPDLAKYASGSALTQLTNGLKSYQAKGLLVRGQAVFNPKVTSLAPPAAPTKASVQDCMDTSGTSLYKANGDPYQDTPGGRRLVLADVERIDGVWKVTSFGVRDVGSCTA